MNKKFLENKNDKDMAKIFMSELCSKILTYKNNRSDLISKSVKIGLIKKSQFSDIDPFTWLSHLFGRIYETNDFNQMLQKVKDEFMIQKDSPSNLDKIIPIREWNQKGKKFFSTGKNEKTKWINDLWDTFEIAINLSYSNDDQILIESLKNQLDKIHKIKVQKVKITVGLSWINDEIFLAIDDWALELLNKKIGLNHEVYKRIEKYAHGLDGMSKNINFGEYFEICKFVKEKIEKQKLPFTSLFEISKGIKVEDPRAKRRQNQQKQESSANQKENKPKQQNQNANNTKKEAKQIQHLNTIYYGVPGTGKTYAANLKAKEIAKKDENIWKITFNQAYGYENFIEGLTAKTNKGAPEYKIEPGIFKKINNKAIKDPNNNYVLIIDEINRGNISKIFGELITLVEESKRGKDNKIKLTHSGKEMYIPNNLYIIGTMNTADKSITSMDTAMRRRFKFIEKHPDYEILKNSKIKNIDLSKLLEIINKRIEAFSEKDQIIGHSYFIEIINSNESEDVKFQKLVSVFENNIIPLLEEIFYGDYEKIMTILSNSDKSQNKANNFITKTKINKDSLALYDDNVDIVNEYSYSININALQKPENYQKIYDKK
ncbi:McrB family protein [Mycoplasmopsis edwardii]|uniref:AAA family ATPase n=1 Tax=Mycoplasmopsis edwardii TaxID=53558 RepID=A0ACD4PI68_9BACT|nr:AAA family ATPase [Mycoplasmopsis edwardii]WBP84330.1 AAA family ATPase [Mycoplasmopsis edwardii]